MKRAPTDRQLEILQLLSIGMSNSEIAATLCCSTETVRSHRQSILLRMSAVDTPHAVAMAFRAGLIE